MNSISKASSWTNNTFENELDSDEDIFDNSYSKNINNGQDDSFEVSDEDLDFDRDIKPLFQLLDKEFFIQQTYSDYSLINNFLDRNPDFRKNFNTPYMPIKIPEKPILKIKATNKEEPTILNEISEPKARSCIQRDTCNTTQSAKNFPVENEIFDDYLLESKNQTFEQKIRQEKQEPIRKFSMERSVEEFYNMLGDEENDKIIKNAILQKLGKDQDLTIKNQSPHNDINNNNELRNIDNKLTSQFGTVKCSNLNESKDPETKFRFRENSNNHLTVCNTIREFSQEGTQAQSRADRSLLSINPNNHTNTSSNFLDSLKSDIQKNRHI